MLDRTIYGLEALKARQLRDQRALAFTVVITLCFLLLSSIFHIYVGRYVKFIVIPSYLLLLLSYRRLLRNFIKEGIWTRLTATQKHMVGGAIEGDNWFKSFRKSDPDADELVRFGFFQKPVNGEEVWNSVSQTYYRYQLTLGGLDYLNEHKTLCKQTRRQLT